MRLPRDNRLIYDSDVHPEVSRDAAADGRPTHSECPLSLRILITSSISRTPSLTTLVFLVDRIQSYHPARSPMICSSDQRRRHAQQSNPLQDSRENRTHVTSKSIITTITQKLRNQPQITIPQSSSTTNPTPKTDTLFSTAPLLFPVSLAVAVAPVPVLDAVPLAVELKLAVAVAFSRPPQNTSLVPPFALIQSSNSPMLCPCARQYRSHPSLYFVTAAGGQHFSMMEV